MAQSLSNDQYLEDYEENWETKKPCIQSYYEPIHHKKCSAADGKVYAVNAFTDTPRATESKDGQQNNSPIAALVDRLLKEARTSCDILKEQGEWKQENTTGRIRKEKFKNGRPKASCLFTSSSSSRLFRRVIKENNEMEITKEILLLMSDLSV